MKKWLKVLKGVEYLRNGDRLFRKLMEKLKGRVSAMTKWLTVPEAAEYLRCGERFLRELMANEQIPHTVFADRALFSIERLDEWLYSMEKGPSARVAQARDRAREIAAISSNANVAVLPGCPHNKVAEIIDELVHHNNFFVSGLGNNLKDDLEKSQNAYLSAKVYAQLSRWCHPKRNSPRERWVKPKAHELSKLLFGKIIDRTRHPSYD
jgi:excisionase family DNA binding protein